MTLRTRRIRKLIEAHPRVCTHAVCIYWGIYGMHCSKHCEARTVVFMLNTLGFCLANTIHNRTRGVLSQFHCSHTIAPYIPILFCVDIIWQNLHATERNNKHARHANKMHNFEKYILYRSDLEKSI